MSEQRAETKKIVLGGDAQVGKSALLARWLGNESSIDYKPTIGIDFKTRTVGKNIQLQILDTSGQERFKSLRPTCYRGAAAVVLFFDITDKASFDHLQAHLQEIGQYVSDSTPIILVGNKADLAEERKVSEEKAQAFADSKGLTYIETSAKTGANVEKTESTLVNLLTIKTQEDESTGLETNSKQSLLKSIDTLAALQPDSENMKNLCDWLKRCLQDKANQAKKQKGIEEVLQNADFKAALNSLWWTKKSIFNSFVNLAITVFLAISIVGFPIAYMSGLLERNKQATGHSCMFFHFGEYQATKVQCNEVFAEMAVSCRV